MSKELKRSNEEEKCQRQCEGVNGAANQLILVVFSYEGVEPGNEEMIIALHYDILNGILTNLAIKTAKQAVNSANHMLRLNKIFSRTVTQMEQNLPNTPSGSL